jgi:hypothetical protein
MIATQIDPWLTLALAALITVGVLALDALLWRCVGVEATFSRAARWAFDEWPLTAVTVFVWVGILIGHLLPSR